jgi:hypothetical protein
MRINKIETLLTERLVKNYITTQENLGQKVEKELKKYHNKLLLEIENKGW